MGNVFRSPRGRYIFSRAFLCAAADLSTRFIASQETMDIRYYGRNEFGRLRDITKNPVKNDAVQT